MAKRFTDTTKWDDEWFMDMPMEGKLFWLYLLDTCDHAGVWKVNKRLASFRLGFDVDVAGTFGDRVEVVENGEYWIIKKFLDFQYGNLNVHNKVHNSALKILDRFNRAPAKPLESPLVGAKDKDKDKEKDKDKDKVKDKDKDIGGQLDQDLAFGMFWSVYPNKKAKKDALKAWKALNPHDALSREIYEHVEKRSRTHAWTKEDRQFVPLPASFIRGELWKDELKIKKTGPTKCPQGHHQWGAVFVIEGGKLSGNKMKKCTKCPSQEIVQ